MAWAQMGWTLKKSDSNLMRERRASVAYKMAET